MYTKHCNKRAGVIELSNLCSAEFL